ncbi:2,5-diketo-D-gluconic acid reductase [Spirochaetia bacterium]|nr:2,5-diketo-D-gluconic acid reductase [Spirochaetia bacterium]
MKKLIVCIVLLAGILFAACTSTKGGKEEKPLQVVNVPTVKLNNGLEMPILGLGTFRLTPEQTEESVYHALTDGYRLIDTANVYMNERAVGRGIQRSGVPREDIFVTTKLWPANYEDVERAINDTLVRLNLEYIDLLLLHQPYGNYVEGYKGMEAAMRQGKVRSIGLSNFYANRFDEIMSIASIPPAVLQVESNPYFHQTVMREYVKSYGTVINAWFPLGGRIDEFNNTQTRLFNDETIVEIASAHNKTSAQVILRWHLQIGNIAIPGSTNPAHILENISIFDFALTDEEMRRISALDTGSGSFDFSNMGDQPNFSFGAPIDFNDQE